MKVRLTVLTVISLMVVSGLFVALSEESDAVNVSTFSDLEAALSSEGEAVVILTSDVEVNAQISITGAKTLTSNNGSTLTRAVSYNHGNLIYINSESSLVVSGNLVVDGNSDWITNNQSDASIENHGNLKFQDSVTIKNNHYGVPSTMWGTTPDGGSAVSNYGTMTIDGGSFTDNSGGDGVIYTSGGTLTITGGSITSNKNRGLTLENASELKMSGGTVDGNGGGIMASGSSFRWTVLNISGGSISNNDSSGTKGAGIYLNNLAKLNLAGGRIENNTLPWSTTGSCGGGIYIGQTSEANLDGGIIAGNSATNGSGIYASGDVSINGATIKGNSVDGIYVNQSTVTMTGGLIDSNIVYLFAGVFKMTGGNVSNIPNAIQTPNSGWGGGFQFGGTAKFDSKSIVSVKVTLVEGETQVLSSHAITLAPTSYVEGDQWVSGSPAGLVSLNHSKIDVCAYGGEKWAIDNGGCLLNTHQAAGNSNADDGNGGMSTSVMIAIVAIAILAVAAFVLKARISR